MSRPHVLIVDDERNFRETLNVLLEMDGFTASGAASGDEALALVEKGLRPDILLLDYRMPGLTGGQTLARLRARQLQVPAVLVTASAEAGDIASRYGFDAVLRKPVGADQVLVVLRQLLPPGRHA